MTTLLKFVHIATIALWAGGLIVLPYLGVGLWLAWSSLRPGAEAR